MFDVLITGGTVYDGTGRPPVQTDIGITGDAIVDIGDLAEASSHLKIKAYGKTVCPGFIDAHSHSDAYILIEPSAPSKVFQGISTEVVGNCGASAAPLVGEYHMPSDWRDKEYPGKWSSVTEYRELLEQQKPAPNIALLVGHNTLRAGIAGYENRGLDADELDRMVQILEKSMDEGARGLSSGLIYAPGMYAPCEELVTLAQFAAKYDGVYSSHMRSEGSALLGAIDEALSIGEATGVRVEISHLKTSGKNNWGLVDGALGRIQEARKKGIRVCADRYPYISAATELDVVLPDWAQEGGREAVLARIRDGFERKRIRADLIGARAMEDWENVTIGSTYHLDNTRFRGMPLVKVAEELGLEHPVDAVLYFVETDELKTGAFFAGMNEQNMEKILCEPYVMLGTDASLRAPDGPLGKDYPHPRAYGSFPKFLRMVLDGDILPLEEAIRKMTSLPAEQFGFNDRGVIEKTRKADIIIIDLDSIRDVSVYACPHRLSEGVEHLFVNGIHTISEGKLTGNRGGCFL